MNEYEINLPADNVDDDMTKRPWMYEPVFGGRVYRIKKGFFYKYDVLICYIPDAIVDCIGSIICLSKTWGPLSYSEMRRCLWAEEPKFMYYLNQFGARLLGCVVVSRLLDFVLDLLSRM